MFVCKCCRNWTDEFLPLDMRANGNQPRATAHPRIMKAREGCLAWDALRARLFELQSAAAANDVVRV